MAAAVDGTGQELPNGQGELLVIRKLWRSVIWTTWGNPEHFTTTYFLQTLGGATYLAGDGGIRDQDADYFTNTGRIDDVLNVPGHRRGIMEIESALVAHALVAEEAVSGERDGTTGESISAFVVLRHARPVGVEAKQIGKELREWIRQRKRPN